MIRALQRTRLPCAGLLLCCATIAQADDSHYPAMAKTILADLVAINTTDADGDTTAAARYAADALLSAGFPQEDVRVIESGPKKGNLVARLRADAATRRPVLLLAHLDVVAADPADWSVPPFQMTEQDGYWYGRGTVDDKDEAAIHITNLIRWKAQGLKTNRDIIVALTADEEGGQYNGVKYLLEHHRDLVDAEFVLNEGGGGLMTQGKRTANLVQAAEKTYQSFHLEVTHPGGHSSRPGPDNAIYRLARALLAVEQLEFPMHLNEVTRASLRQGRDTLPTDLASAVNGVLSSPPDQAAVRQLSASPMYNALLRTTCVATQLKAGHAENALPQRATATVNCRIVPGATPRDVQASLARAINDPQLRLSPVEDAQHSPASPLSEAIMAPIYAVTEEMWPGVAVLPAMSTGATDGLYFRQAGIPVYGTSGLFREADDNRAHGRDERVSPKVFYDGLEYLNRLVTRYVTD